MPLIKLVYSPKNMNKNDTDKFLTMKVELQAPGAICQFTKYSKVLEAHTYY